MLYFYQQSIWPMLIYVADHDAFPYGEKSSAKLQEILTATVEKIIDRFQPAIIVIACNTASVTTLEWLRNHFRSVLFVGVVPAIKPASLYSTDGTIGLLATERTVAGEYLHDLISQFIPDTEVITVIAGDLVRNIEQHAVSCEYEPRNEVQTYISNIVTEFRDNSIDRLVLGCTHFVYIRKEIERLCGNKVIVIDSREGVTQRVCELSKTISHDTYMQKDHTAPMSFYINSHQPLPHNTAVLLDRHNISFEGSL